jgi:hypothetical protein
LTEEEAEEKSKEAIDRMPNTLRALIGSIYDQCDEVKQYGLQIGPAFNALTTVIRGLEEQGEIEHEQVEGLIVLMKATHDGLFETLNTFRNYTNACLARHGVVWSEEQQEAEAEDLLPM